MNGVPSPFKSGIVVRTTLEYQGQSRVNLTPDCAVPDCKDTTVLVVNFGAFRMALCAQHGEDLKMELFNILDDIEAARLLQQHVEALQPPVCSICRQRHGSEIVHASE